MKLILKLLITLICLVSIEAKTTGSYYSDSEKSIDNCFILNPGE